MTRRALWREAFLLATGGIFSLVSILSDNALASGIPGMAALLVLVFALMLRNGFGIARHGAHVARAMDQPYGTLLLTLSIDFIEVASIAAVILHRDNNPTLLRASLLSVVMIILNAMVGMSLLIGAWRHGEQHYNLHGANSYLSVLLPLAVLTMVLPGFVDFTNENGVSGYRTAFIAIMTSALYAAFLLLQTGRHRGYFVDGGATQRKDGAHAQSTPVATHAAFLAANLVVTGLLASQIAVPIDYFLENLKMPALLGGIVMALLVATPEAAEAVRAARRNHLQHAINVLLGSALATIGITVPAILLIGALAGRSVELTLHGADLIMLLLTLTVSVVTFGSGRTTVLQGAVHLLLFAAYLMLAIHL